MKSILAFDSVSSFINSHLQSPKTAAPDDPRLTKCITISRQHGCGAHVFAEELAARLGVLRPEDKRRWTIFDHSLVEAVLRDHQLPGRLATFMPEDRIPRMEEIIHDIFSLHPAPEVLVRQTVETMLRLAELGHVIIVGRAGNITTARLPGVLNVRLIGSMEKRIAYLEKFHKLSRKEAVADITRTDRGRRRYVKRYFGRDIDSSLHYHLVINTDCLTLPEAAVAVAELAVNRNVAEASAPLKAAA